MRLLGPTVLEGMKTISAEAEIARDDINEYIASIIGGNLEESLIRMAIHFVPDTAAARVEVRKAFETTPLPFLITNKLVDYEGRPESKVGSLEEDMEGNVIKSILGTLQVSAFFLHETIVALVEKFGLDSTTLLDFLLDSPLFEGDRRSILERGLQAHFKGDYLVSAHLLIPQVEATIRKFADLVGVPTIKRGRNETLQLRLLDELLRDNVIEEKLGEDMSLYFRILFTDQRGWNLRNDISHGRLRQQDFEHGMADSILHALLCLALIREQHK